MSRPTFAEPDASPSWLARNRGEHSTAEGEAASEGLAGQGPVPSAAPPVPAPLLAGLGGGQPLAQAERQRWQGEAGADLAAVRVHRGPAAARAAASLAARAFTIGDHVVFGAGQYTPGTPAGDGLMRHELTHVLQQRRGVVPLAPQRQADPQAHPQVARDKAPRAATPGTAVLQSPHPEVGGRTVAEVGRDLRERAERYRKMSAANVRSSAEQQQTERDWYADRGVAGSVIEWFNRRVPTDPARWGSVVAVYEHATRLFDEALAVAVNADTVADFARRCQDALERFQAAMELERRYLAEWRRYIEGFAGAAESLYSTAVVVRDLSFATAISIAVVVAAPAVAGGASAFAAQTLRLGATGARVFGAGSATLTMGVAGASLQGQGQALGTLGAQTAGFVADLIRGRQAAVDNFDFRAVAAQGWEGMKRGFVDGVLAIPGLSLERAVAGQTARAAERLLGSGGASLTAMLLRRALTRAVSGGASGAVISALQSGLRAAMEGRDLDGITAAMQQGWKTGLVAGTVLGGAGGALEARQASRLKTSLADSIRQQMLESSRTFRELPANYEADDVLHVWVNFLKANPKAGKNERILGLLPKVWWALHDPDTIARTVAEISMEANLGRVLGSPDAVTRNTEAVMRLSRRTGAPVRILGPEESYFPQEFFGKVVTGGSRFLDRSILKDIPEHGAATHLIQDLAVDRLLRRVGVRAEEFRAMLAEAVGPNGQVIGEQLWVALFDAFEQDINRPEVLYPILNAALGGLE